MRACFSVSAELCKSLRTHSTSYGWAARTRLNELENGMFALPASPLDFSPPRLPRQLASRQLRILNRHKKRRQKPKPKQPWKDVLLSSGASKLVMRFPQIPSRLPSKGPRVRALRDATSQSLHRPRGFAFFLDSHAGGRSCRCFLSGLASVLRDLDRAGRTVTGFAGSGFRAKDSDLRAVSPETLDPLPTASQTLNPKPHYPKTF